jgi:UDP-4-amino-4-deoxy-L-arabinose formyltransferase/UDP-glucuronic acid dehydrogenase (UDP-4-keto-hexauronic acid decarboxylating)
MSLTVALAAEEAAGVQALRLLAHRGHDLVAVFTDSEEEGTSASVASTARSLGVPVRTASAVRTAGLADWLSERQVEILISVHSRHLIHADVLAVPARGAYNLHPGPLPECAGLNTPSWALYEGAERHGVTLHHMTPIFDSGSIVFADEFDIGPQDTGLSVLMQCVRRGMKLLERLLEIVEHGDPVPAYPQDPSRRRWFAVGPPQEGLLDWSGPARRVVDFVRACDYSPFPSPWGFPRCIVGGVEIAVPAASVAGERESAAPGTIVHADGGAVLIAAADAWVRVDQVEIGDWRGPATEAFGDGARLALPGSSPRLLAR